MKYVYLNKGGPGLGYLKGAAVTDNHLNEIIKENKDLGTLRIMDKKNEITHLIEHGEVETKTIEKWLEEV